jgi:SpoVK/Ycf46/Vps4 family AAA+-type ATPase
MSTNLFNGTPEAAKAYAVQLGAETKKEIHTVNLSSLISAHIGETEKNINQLFADAEKNNWILFFDEADALFGKRTEVKDAHDKYANQEVAYLLQRIESHKGSVVMATSNSKDIDPHLLTQFKTVLHLPKK